MARRIEPNTQPRNWIAWIDRIGGRVGLFLLVGWVAFALLLKADRPIRRVFGVDAVAWAVDPLSRWIPELFHKRNDREAWHVRKPRLVYGYIDTHSVFPGESFNVMASVGPDSEALSGHLELSRIGFYEKGRDHAGVWKSAPVRIEPHVIEPTTAAIGTAWRPVATVRAETDWASGFYSLAFVADDGRAERRIAFVVVKDPRVEGDVLVKLANNTYQAYNQWGGHSLYRSRFLGKERRGQMVSFDRPLGSETRHDFFNWEYHYVRWLEELAQREDFSVHYATNFDLSEDPRFSENYALLVSVGHDEYWTREEFQHTHRRIFDLGKNTLFLGANTAYWQVRYADLHAQAGHPGRGRQMICFKSSDDPIRYAVGESEARDQVTTLFREGGRRPETMLAGVAYQDFLSGERRYPYFVEDASLPFFAGTGYSAGDSLGEMVGHEWDNIDPEGDGRRLFVPGVSAIPRIDSERIQVVLTGHPIAASGRQGLAQGVYFESEAGARVFSSGTNDWAMGFRMEGTAGERFRRLNRNLVIQFLGRL